jgi:hypothetical protein
MYFKQNLKTFLEKIHNLLHKCLCRQTWNHRREISYREREREKRGVGPGGQGGKLQAVNNFN